MIIAHVLQGSFQKTVRTSRRLNAQHTLPTLNLKITTIHTKIRKLLCKEAAVSSVLQTVQMIASPCRVSFQHKMSKESEPSYSNY